MTRMGERRATAALLAALCLGWTMTASAADENNISFKRRGNEEKRFVASVGTAIIKAAHKTAKKIDLLKHEYTKPKAGRTELAIKMEFHGAATGRRYVADIVVKIDSSNKDAWEVLNIDYADNDSVPFNGKKIQELIKQMNK
ncbi:MAG TPA: hypothetical protein VN688_30085 [Gemmataceae bacterium]|nr:hypothetical protein [Gemmataceae bacterium]